MKQVSLLREKTKIFIPKACLLMGIPDNRGILRQDEVFIQIKRYIGSPAEVITGPVAIVRNPCLHPGDIRSAMAVNNSMLQSYVNVIILPTDVNGSSISSDCSGGDLDGDKFGIIYDPSIAPPKDCIHEPLDYDNLLGGQLNTEPCDTLEEFYLSTIANEALGRIAHIHLAVCDHLKEGACHPIAMKIAESQSLAVDYPKTGIHPLVPEDSQIIIKEIGFPDFMEKSGSSQYF